MNFINKYLYLIEKTSSLVHEVLETISYSFYFKPNFCKIYNF